MKKNQDKELKMNRKDAIHKIRDYGKYAALTALGTYLILDPKKAQAQSPRGGFPDPGDGF
jgi:hypothetical protein|tara:strand:+ start:96 stop:275 length:180 start_codon:yes stop_codon:yes gene_type:complete